MKIKDIQNGIWDIENFVNYKMDREIVNIRDARLHDDGYIYAVITFAPIEGDKLRTAHTYNKPFIMVVKFDTKFEGDRWSKND